MSFIFTKAFIATVGQQLLVAGALSCHNAGNPTECLGVSDAAGNRTCAWLMLSGSCADAYSDEVMSSPATCCSSQAVGSPCKHQSDKLYDGMCALPAGRQGQQGAISLDEMDHWLHLAFAIYCPESEVTQWKCGTHCDAVTGLSMIRYISKVGWTDNIEHAVMVAYKAQTEEMILSFRGTDNSESFLENWLTNLEYFKKKPFEQYPDVGVHTGFWDAWQSVKPDVMSAIDEVKAAHPGVTTIRVAGHSLGGAIATNAAMDLKLNYGFLTSVVNFGSPRPGDFAYHTALLSEVPHWRVTHHKDIVPHVPPAALGFYHASTEINFPEETGREFKVCDGSGEDPTCANSCGYISCTSVDDHLDYLDWAMTCGSSSSVVV